MSDVSRVNHAGGLPALRAELATSLAVRTGLALALCWLCFRFEWLWLRQATVLTLLALSRWLGLPVSSSAITDLQVAGTTIEFTLSCTMVEYFCAAIPFLWNRSASPLRNARDIGLGFVALFAFNIVRQQLGLLGYVAGLPWWFAHDLPSGVAHFLMIVAVVRRRAWMQLT